jgi:membrane fusion protein, copper/silver efflux system
MNKPVVIAAFVAVAIGSFVVGRISRSGKTESPSSKRVLYYVDPMHPNYRSDRPGTAPDCGMALEPVYEGDELSSKQQLAPGVVTISPEKQQLIGLRVEKVERSAGARLVRTTGRVAIEENSLYRVLAATDGWVRTLNSNAPGTLVRKDEVLATFYSNDFLRAEQSFFFALKSLDRVKSSGRDTPEQIKQVEDQVRTSEEDLRSLGMGDPQLREIRKKQEVTREINIASPVTGLVVARSLSPGQRLERSAEMYRIANIEKVLILADLFPGVSSSFAAGTKVRVTVRELQKTLYATVSSTLPLFDPTSRVLKLRLEADNPGLQLRPDMFVDIEFNAKNSPGVSIPAEAVLDSGLQKIVYVESSDGVFEPRTVEIGSAFGDRVTVKRGLMEGDRVVVAGNFMIDSESRMRATAPSTAPTATAHQHTAKSGTTSGVDPVCGMTLSAEDMKAGKHAEMYHGRMLVFCSEQCQKNFRQNPEKYVGEKADRADTARAGIGAQ